MRPEVLGLPSATGKGEYTLDRARELMRVALEEGDEQQFSRLVFDLYLGGQLASQICDRSIAPAFSDLGERWQHGELEVYEERRGAEVCMRVIHRLLRALPEAPDDAPTAIGGTLEGDPYTIPTTMVEVALRENHWRARSYGVGLPVETLERAIETVRPRLFWLSVSYIGSEEKLLEQTRRLYSSATSTGTAFVVGGQCLTEKLRREMQYTAHCDTLQHLIAFAQTLAPESGTESASTP